MVQASERGGSFDWHDANQRALLSALASVRQALEKHTSRVLGHEVGAPPSLAESSTEPAKREEPSALSTLSTAFRLSPFERGLLLLSAGIELDSRFANVCAAAQGDPRRPYPTFSLALAALPGAHWSALSPSGPLRHWLLLRLEPGELVTTSPLRIDERILHYLAGVSFIDERLRAILENPPLSPELLPSHQCVAEHVVTAWTDLRPASWPLIQLCGQDTAAKRDVAALACARLGLDLRVITAGALPASLTDAELIARLWEREAVLEGRALLVDCNNVELHEPSREAALTGLVQRLNGPVIVASRAPFPNFMRRSLQFEVPKPTAAEQRSLWLSALGGASSNLNGKLDHLVSEFSLSTAAIRAAAAEALQTSEPAHLGDRLWKACRRPASPRFGHLAQHIEPAATWDHLVLPAAQRQILRGISIQVRHRFKVHEDWGFRARGSRGLGLSVLFAGQSGTGKTLAAEILARELGLDLFRIDLSQVVSKYIGETEKNLSRVFDEAEGGGAILFFDEADALFGKRSEVHDSHDRYANIEISYLLQRMEAYRGLAILATNMKNSLDTAFLRRIRFVVDFPFPDAAQRAEIWRRIFPDATPTEGLDLTKLARLSVAGGNIRNIALNAAFLAVEAGEPVRMSHILNATRSEYAKLEKQLTEAEVRGWV